MRRIRVTLPQSRRACPGRRASAWGGQTRPVGRVLFGGFRPRSHLAVDAPVTVAGVWRTSARSRVDLIVPEQVFAPKQVGVDVYQFFPERIHGLHLELSFCDVLKLHVDAAAT